MSSDAEARRYTYIAVSCYLRTRLLWRFVNSIKLKYEMAVLFSCGLEFESLEVINTRLTTYIDDFGIEKLHTLEVYLERMFSSRFVEKQSGHYRITTLGRCRRTDLASRLTRHSEQSQTWLRSLQTLPTLHDLYTFDAERADRELGSVTPAADKTAHRVPGRAPLYWRS